MRITRVGVDIGKYWFHLGAVARDGNVLWRKVLNGTDGYRVYATKSPVDATIGMVAKPAKKTAKWTSTFKNTVNDNQTVPRLPILQFRTTLRMKHDLVLVDSQCHCRLFVVNAPLPLVI